MITVNDITITEAQLEAEVVRHHDAEDPMMEAAHELVLRELLLQKARELEVPGDDEEAAIQAVLQAEVATPVADDAACRRYYEQHPERFRTGELVEVAHILFQLTSGIDAQALRAKAVQILNELHHAGAARFGEFARQYSNCPSSAGDGQLGQVGRGDTVPEFEQAVFAMPAHTLGERLVETRFGFHIVRTGNKAEGSIQPYEAVQRHIAEWLEAASRERATHQYLQWLVGQAKISGVPMEGAATPLVQ